VVRIAVAGVPDAAAHAYEAELKALGHQLVKLSLTGRRDDEIPAVVLVGGQSGERIGRAILRRYPDTVIVLLVSDTNVNAIRRGLTWGASAIIDIAVPARRTAAEVAMLCEGDVVIVPRSASRLLSHSSAAKLISRDQLECVRLLDSDLTVAEMALLMHRSKRSMHRDLQSLYRTLAVDGRKAALAVARDLGVLEDPGGRKARP
jgi:DNA-binding NarL/FixJ family response regulator